MVTTYVHFTGKMIFLSVEFFLSLTLATDVSLGEEEKDLIFSFVIMAVNCCKILDFSLIERIVGEFLAY